MRRLLALAASALTLAATAVVISAPAALADPSADDWAAVRSCESGGNYSINTGNGYYGAYQFDLGTWRSVGGTGNPASASREEQDYRALYLYRMRGWSPWICAALAGLSEDSSAKTGVVPSREESAYMSGGTSNYAPPSVSQCNIGGNTAPPWGGVVFVKNETYRDMTCFQRQLGRLGYGLTGTGYFGNSTLSALQRFQRDRGMAVTSEVTRDVWVAAWGNDGGDKAGVTPAPAPAPAPVPAPAPAPAPAPNPSPVVARTPPPGITLYPGVSAESCKIGQATAPAWPGKSWTGGAYDKDLACWQMQMGARGYNLYGTGWYGGTTLIAAMDIQKTNGLPGSGLIGPQTWKAAWEGKI